MKLLRSIIAFAILIALVFFLTNYVDPVKQKVFSTLHLPQNLLSNSISNRSHTISNQLMKDVTGQFGVVEKQVLSMKPTNVTHFLSRAQKIQQDVLGVKTSIEKQVSQSAKKK